MAITVKKTCQVSGFVLLTGLFFLALSVGSYSAQDPTWNHYPSQHTARVDNLTGIVGASLADVMVQLFGSTIFLFIVVGGVTAWHLMRVHLTAVGAMAWRGGLLLAAMSSALHLIFTTDPVFGLQRPTGGAGGMLGTELASALVHYVKPTGAFLVIVAALILSLFVGVEQYYLAWPIRRGREAVRRFVADVVQRIEAVYGRLLARLWDGAMMVRRGFEAVTRCIRRDGEAAAARTRHHGTSFEAVTRFIRRDQAMAPEPSYDAGAPYGFGSAAPFPVAEAQEEEPLDDWQPAIPVTAPEPSLPPPRLYQEEQPSPPPPRPPAKAPRRRSNAAGLPSLDILERSTAVQQDKSPEELHAQARFLEQKLRDFGVDGEVVQVLPGPVITMYEFAPAPGVKVNKIVNLQDDLALVMRALSVRVVAPIPGKAVVGIEIPNKRRETVRLRDLLDSEAFRTSTSPLTLALGKDILGQPMVTDLALIPHLLIAGATGSGKSVGLNSMICSLLFRATPLDVKVIMIDPKMLELSIYDGIPHLLVPVVTSPKQAAVALRRVVQEMERRYQILAAQGVRSIAQYNQTIADQQAQLAAATSPASPADESITVAEKLPYLVVVIDELSDLMMVSSREVEDSLTRIAQMARAAGIHLIVATQRPSVDVLTGVIKANFPARMSFQVSSKTDSRTILDANGAEKLLGRGDMLFLAPGTSKPQRIHGAFVSEAEINRLVAAWKDLEQPQYDENFLDTSEDPVAAEDEEYDEKYDEAVALVSGIGHASISMLQRRLRVGYNRAARMIETMEREGIIGPADGVKPREVLVRREYDEA